jgi:hypothetical protein
MTNKDPAARVRNDAAFVRCGLAGGRSMSEAIPAISAFPPYVRFITLKPAHTDTVGFEIVKAYISVWVLDKT